MFKGRNGVGKRETCTEPKGSGMYDHYHNASLLKSSIKKECRGWNECVWGWANEKGRGGARGEKRVKRVERGEVYRFVYDDHGIGGGSGRMGEKAE